MLVSQCPTRWDKAWIMLVFHSSQLLSIITVNRELHERQPTFWWFELHLKMVLYKSRLSRKQFCTYAHTYNAHLLQREVVDNIHHSYLCWISRLSFLFLVWSAGEGEFKFLAGGATSAIVSLEPSWSEVPLSVFLHLALRFWNHTWSRRAVQAEYHILPNVKQEKCF